MNIKEILEVGASVIAGLGGGGAIVFGLSNYLGKVWSERAIERLRQENSRMNLELSHQLGLLAEQVKNSLRMVALEHEVRFSKLHEKRAEVIDELWQRLVAAQRESERFVSVEGYDTDNATREEAWRSTEQTFREVYLFIEKRRIYLSEPVCASLGTFLDNMRRHVIRVSVYGSLQGDPPPHIVEERRDAFLNAHKAFDSEIPGAIQALGNEFRKMLGGDAGV